MKIISEISKLGGRISGTVKIQHSEKFLAGLALGAVIVTGAIVPLYGSINADGPADVVAEDRVID